MGKGLYTARSLIVRCGIIVLGVFITSLGGSFYIVANLGSDPVTAFVQGIANVSGIGFGMAMNIFNVVCFFIVLVINRKLINIGTVIYTLLLGVAFDLIFLVFGATIGDAPSMLARIIMLCAGTVLLAFGLGLYQAARLGAGPSDALNQIISKKTKIPLKWERIGFDIVMVAGGFFMGGVVHVGTVIGMLTVGPIMAPVMEFFMPIVDKWSGTEKVEKPCEQ